MFEFSMSDYRDWELDSHIDIIIILNHSIATRSNELVPICGVINIDA